jgi:hypothetical protein
VAFDAVGIVNKELEPRLPAIRQRFFFTPHEIVRMYVILNYYSVKRGNRAMHC